MTDYIAGFILGVSFTALVAYVAWDLKRIELKRAQKQRDEFSEHATWWENEALFYRSLHKSWVSKVKQKEKTN